MNSIENLSHHELWNALYGTNAKHVQYSYAPIFLKVLVDLCEVLQLDPGLALILH